MIQDDDTSPRAVAERAAEAAVEVHDGEWTKDRWRREGYKKLDSVIINTGTIHESVEIRVRVTPPGDSGRGGASRFAAALRGATLVSDDFGALTRRLRTHLTERTALVFERWITISYECCRADELGKSYGTSWSNPDGDVCGVRLTFEVCEISNVVGNPQHGNRIWRRLRRVGDAWEAATTDQPLYKSQILESSVPYTEARYQSLLAIQAGIVRIAALLDQVVGDAAIESGEAAARLDQPAALRLLAGSNSDSDPDSVTEVVDTRDAPPAARSRSRKSRSGAP